MAAILQATFFITNYVNPVCRAATVCHQVRCMYWGHLGHFYRAISHLKWCKIVCRRYLACTFSPYCFHVYVCQCRPQTLAAICRNMGIWDAFVLGLPGKIYLGFVSLIIIVFWFKFLLKRNKMSRIYNMSLLVQVVTWHQLRPWPGKVKHIVLESVKSTSR